MAPDLLGSSLLLPPQVALALPCALVPALLLAAHVEGVVGAHALHLDGLGRQRDRAVPQHGWVCRLRQRISVGFTPAAGAQPPPLRASVPCHLSIKTPQRAMCTPTRPAEMYHLAHNDTQG